MADFEGKQSFWKKFAPCIFPVAFPLFFWSLISSTSHSCPASCLSPSSVHPSTTLQPLLVCVTTINIVLPEGRIRRVLNTFHPLYLNFTSVLLKVYIYSVSFNQKCFYEHYKNLELQTFNGSWGGHRINRKKLWAEADSYRGPPFWLLAVWKRGDRAEIWPRAPMLLIKWNCPVWVFLFLMNTSTAGPLV